MGRTRIGYGYDVHKFAEERDLYLGGVKIPHALGLLGHSDADVALHALCDALLGAAAMGDIGKSFPDTDPKYKGISSVILLKNVMDKLRGSGWRIGNADITIVAQEPKLAPYIEDMRKTIAKAVSADISQISVKATTTEHLGFEGRSEGIGASAVAMIEEDE